jgi:hypothetical protein
MVALAPHVDAAVRFALVPRVEPRTVAVLVVRAAARYAVEMHDQPAPRTVRLLIRPSKRATLRVALPVAARSKTAIRTAPRPGG